jgi:r-opsin
MIPQFFSANGFVLEGFLTACTIDYLSQDFYSRLFTIIMIIGGLLIPLFLIIFFYIRIWFLLKSNKLLSNELYSNKNENYKIPNSESILSFNSKRKDIIIRRQKKYLKNVILLIILFCFAWFPYGILLILAQLGYYNLVNAYTTNIPVLLAKLSSVYNPIVFIFSCKIFKKSGSNSSNNNL